MAKLGDAFNKLIKKLENPDLDEGTETLIEKYQDNLLLLKDVEGQKSRIAIAIAQRSPILFTIANSFLFKVNRTRQKIKIINNVGTSGLLNTRYKYAGFDKKRKYLAIFLNAIYKK